MTFAQIDDDLRAVQDLAWDIKDTCDDLALRKISHADRAVLQSVARDLIRMRDRVVGVRDKRKRSGDEPTNEAAAPEAAPGGES